MDFGPHAAAVENGPAAVPAAGGPDGSVNWPDSRPVVRRRDAWGPLTAGVPAAARRLALEEARDEAGGAASGGLEGWTTADGGGTVTVTRQESRPEGDA